MRFKSTPSPGYIGFETFIVVMSLRALAGKNGFIISGHRHEDIAGL
jgi:hypothetical protein